MEGILAIIGAFGMLPVIIWALSHYRHKTQRANTELLKAMVNKGDTLTPEIIQSLGVQKNPKNHDLRRGVTLTATGIAAFIFAYFTPDADSKAAIMGLSMFPLFIGIAYTGLWVLVSRKDT